MEWDNHQPLITLSLSLSIAEDYLVVVDVGNCPAKIRKVNVTSREVKTLITGYSFYAPSSIVIGLSDQIYLVDADSVVTMRDENTSLFAGHTFISGYSDGSCDISLFNGLFGIAVTKSEDKLYLADSFNRAIRVINILSCNVSTFIKDFAYEPISVAVDNTDSYVYVSLKGISSIFRYSTNSSSLHSDVFASSTGNNPIACDTFYLTV